MKCNVAHCTRDVFARGWCQGHYLRQWRHGDVQESTPLGRGTLGRENHYTPKATEHPTKDHLIFAAGFLEGEGCFVKHNTSAVTGIQKDPEYLFKLQQLFGGTVKQHKSARGVHVWAVYGTRARGIMMTLYKFLGTRRKAQIRKALV